MLARLAVNTEKAFQTLQGTTPVNQRPFGCRRGGLLADRETHVAIVPAQYRAQLEVGFKLFPRHLNSWMADIWLLTGLLFWGFMCQRKCDSCVAANRYTVEKVRMNGTRTVLWYSKDE